MLGPSPGGPGGSFISACQALPKRSEYQMAPKRNAEDRGAKHGGKIIQLPERFDSMGYGGFVGRKCAGAALFLTRPGGGR